MNDRMSEAKNEEAMSELELQCCIQGRLGRHIRELRLLMGDQGLILRGHADSFYAKQLAQHTVMAMGLRVAANEIEVA